LRGALSDVGSATRSATLNGAEDDVVGSTGEHVKHDDAQAMGGAPDTLGVVVEHGPKLLEGTFIREPRAETYRGLISVLATMAHRALLAERILHTHDGVVFGGFSPEGERLHLRIHPWCAVEEERSEWPGTQLLGGATALVREYALSSEVISALQTTVEGLFEWQSGLPEDLAFLREDGEAMMFAISHENDGGVALHPEERERLLRECPEITSCLEWHPSGLR
jgi:hypothetical protein